MALYQDTPMISLIGGFDQLHFLDAAIVLIYQFFLLFSFYAQSNISILWLFSLICMAAAAGAAFFSWERDTVKI
jgi:hypothetical protein